MNIQEKLFLNGWKNNIVLRRKIRKLLNPSVLTYQFVICYQETKYKKNQSKRCKLLINLYDIVLNTNNIPTEKISLWKSRFPVRMKPGEQS